MTTRDNMHAGVKQIHDRLTCQANEYVACYKDAVVARRGQQPLLRNLPARRRLDVAGDVHNTIRTANNREKQSTQYLTRFGNVPTSSGQGRERFY